LRKEKESYVLPKHFCFFLIDYQYSFGNFYSGEFAAKVVFVVQDSFPKIPGRFSLQFTKSCGVALPVHILPPKIAYILLGMA
jgi:hypothetical protein